jgi:hypothetical protein
MKPIDDPDHARRRVNRAEFAAALIILAIAATAIAEAMKLPFGGFHAPDAGFIPVIEATLLACSGVVLLASALKPRTPAPGTSSGSDGRRIMLCLSSALVVYVVVLPIFGFAISTAFFLWAAISFWRFYPVFTSAILAVVMTSGLYVLFVTVLQMPLPHGALIPFRG